MAGSEQRFMTVEEFEGEVVQSGKRVLVDFYAPWCAPCKKLSPLLDEVETEEGIEVLKLNIDHAPEVAVNLRVRGVPTLVLYKDGEISGTKVGALSKGQLLDFVEAYG
jgi:thioredoxin 1